MSLLKIIKYPNSKLRKKCAFVREETDFYQILKLIDKMYEVMYFMKGIGLAAPQVGVGLRVVVVDIGDGEPLSMINPSILHSEGEIEMEEMCLSIPFVSGYVKRANKIGVRYIDVNRQVQESEFEGLKAVCIQHEIEHLEGKLYIDRLSRLKRQMIDKKYKKFSID